MLYETTGELGDLERSMGRRSRLCLAYHRFAAIKTLDQAIKGAMNDRRWTAAVRGVEAKAKLLGLNEPDALMVTSQEAHPTESMTSSQLRAYMKEQDARREMLLTEIAESNSVH